MDRDFEHNRHLENVTGTEEELEELIREGEHQEQDFKFRVDSSQKIAKTLTAFANTDGGRLLIGVKDNGKVTGVDPEEEFYMIEGAADLYCKPTIPFVAEVYQFEDKLVLEVIIKASADRPHYVKEPDGRFLAYVRQADENFVANKPLILFLRDKTPKSQRKNLVAYGPAERKLFDYLSENKEVSISKFARLAKLPMWRAEKIIAMFLKWEVIQWKATDKGVRFSLVED